MSKLEHQLRLSLIREHMGKSQDFLERAKIAINPSLQIVLMEHAREHLEDAEQLREELAADLTKRTHSAFGSNQTNQGKDT